MKWFNKNKNKYTKKEIDMEWYNNILSMVEYKEISNGVEYGVLRDSLFYDMYNFHTNYYNESYENYIRYCGSIIISETQYLIEEQKEMEYIRNQMDLEKKLLDKK